MKLDRVIAVRNNKTVYRDDDRVVKVFVSGTSKAEVLNEALNQTRMEEIGLNVPSVLEVSKIDGKWAIVSDYIRGKTLSQLMAEEPQRISDHIDLFVAVQADIHNSECPSLTQLQDNMIHKIAQCELEAAVKNNILSLLDEMSSESGVCHGDFTPSNIIIDENGTPFIIDWAKTSRGSKFADIAKTYLLLVLRYKQDIAKLYLTKMCEKNSVDISEVEKWLPLVAASEMAGRKGDIREILHGYVHGTQN